jgi:hypothetical protein
MHLQFSKDIEALLQRSADHPLSIKEILTETSERSFSLMIGLLVLPFLLPMPPGISTILGSGCLLLSLQMAMGWRKPWLPRKIASFQFPPAFTRQILTLVTRLNKVVEKFFHPRMTGLVRDPKIWRINGLCLAWLTILLMLPVPATNPIPTVAILLLVIATLEGDGLVMCVSYVLTLLITLFFGVIGYLLWQAPGVIQNWFS